MTSLSPGRSFLLLPLGLLAAVLGGCGASGDPPVSLPALDIDPERVTVSGLSSGAYLAHQLHLAFPTRIQGAALLAGGPYGCAEGDLGTALERCMRPQEGHGPDVDRLAATVRQRSGAGQLGDLSGLRGDRVYVWHGALDEVVSGDLSRATAALYRELEPEIRLDQDFEQAVAHLLPTAGEGGDCQRPGSPHLAACGIDKAGEVLNRLYALDVDVPAEASGRLLRFDAARYAPEGQPGDRFGFVYLPEQCASGTRCGLHIALHGCEQSVEAIGQAFVRDAGFNRWADAADLVVLYPQARSSFMPLNPKGCWDWWGYTGEHYDTRAGLQIRWIAAMAAALGAPLE